MGRDDRFLRGGLRDRGRLKVYLIDGYNLIHRLPDLRAELARGLESARRRLESKCLPLLTRRDVRAAYIIYDGQQEGYEKRSAALHIVYTRRKQSADSRILEWVRAAEGAQDEIVIVSDDREIGWHGKGLGARSMGCEVFESLLAQRTGPAAAGGGVAGRTGGSGSPVKDGLKPSDCSRITDEYRKQLGL